MTIDICPTCYVDGKVSPNAIADLDCNGTYVHEEYTFTFNDFDKVFKLRRLALHMMKHCHQPPVEFVELLNKVTPKVTLAIAKSLSVIDLGILADKPLGKFDLHLYERLQTMMDATRHREYGY